MIKFVERFFDIFIVFLGAYLTAKFGYKFWIERHKEELAVEYQAEYLSSLGEFLNLTQEEIKLRNDNKGNIKSKEIYGVSVKRTSIEYKIDMDRVKMRINQINDYTDDEGKIHKIDQMFKKVFVDLSEKYNKDKWCTKWKAFTKGLLKKEDIEKQIDQIREYLKQNF